MLEISLTTVTIKLVQEALISHSYLLKNFFESSTSETMLALDACTCTGNCQSSLG